MTTAELPLGIKRPVLDVVYPVRPGDHNEELRYSLRALEKHLPHANVWIVGYKPHWVTNVEYLPGNTSQYPRANLWHNLLAACQHPDISSELVIMNDDFFITEPLDEVPILFRGPLADHRNMKRVKQGSAWWRESLQTTETILKTLGYEEPISYELHTPFRVKKKAMANVLQRFRNITPDNPPQWRTLYGNLHRIGGKQHKDGKSYRPGPVNKPFHSTDDSSWRWFARQFRDMFPEPSRYEQR